jgi:hypothetical protein
LAGIRSVGVLNIVLAMPAQPPVAKASHAAPLIRLATRCGEICRLALICPLICLWPTLIIGSHKEWISIIKEPGFTGRVFVFWGLLK